jgi:hypothetical protein
MSATDCEWLNDKCNRKCELYEDSECVNHAGRCRFNYNGCSLKYLDAASCNGDQQCMFVSATGDCREACSQYQVAQYPGTVLSQSAASTQESFCAADAACVWDSTNYRCGAHCILLSTLAEYSTNLM